MRTKKFPFPLLITGILFVTGTIYSITHFPPTYTFSLVGLSIPLFPFVLFQLWIGMFCTITFITRSLLHGLLLSSASITYLLLRYVGLTSLFFLVLLLAICVGIELFFLKNPKSQT